MRYAKEGDCLLKTGKLPIGQFSKRKKDPAFIVPDDKGHSLNFIDQPDKLLRVNIVDIHHW